MLEVSPSVDKSGSTGDGFRFVIFWVMTAFLLTFRRQLQPQSSEHRVVKAGFSETSVKTCRTSGCHDQGHTIKTFTAVKILELKWWYQFLPEFRNINSSLRVSVVDVIETRSFKDLFHSPFHPKVVVTDTSPNRLRL